jgi:hypothetical protein
VAGTLKASRSRRKKRGRPLQRGYRESGLNENALRGAEEGTDHGAYCDRSRRQRISDLCSCPGRGDHRGVPASYGSTVILFEETAPQPVILETSAEAFKVADQAIELGHDVRVVPATLVPSLGVGRDAQILSEGSGATRVRSNRAEEDFSEA